MFVTVTGWAQLPKDETTGLFTYQEVIDQPGTPEELYTRAREWFVHAYKDANKVIQLDDKANSTIIGKGKYMVYLSMNNRFIQHTITIEAKENRYRYTITNFILDWGNGVATVPLESLQKMYQAKAYNSAAEQSRDLINSLKAGMAREKADW